MRTLDAINYAKNATGLAELLGVTASAISQWGEFPPDTRQLQLERLTVGGLKAEPGCLDRVLGISTEAKTA